MFPKKKNPHESVKPFDSFGHRNTATDAADSHGWMSSFCNIRQLIPVELPLSASPLLTSLCFHRHRHHDHHQNSVTPPPPPQLPQESLFPLSSAPNFPSLSLHNGLCAAGSSISLDFQSRPQLKIRDNFFLTILLCAVT